MIRFRDRGARGRHRAAMVDAYHSFSFGDYNDSKHMGFRDLRVLNEDFVMPGVGFPEHGHADMEIVTIVLKGAIAHRDSLGNERVLRAGEVQRMSAGTGIRHSELNPSPNDRAHALQIWILPAAPGGAPSYEQKTLSAERNTWLPIASGDATDGMRIGQDAAIARVLLDEGRLLTRALRPGRGAWVQVIDGIIGLNGTEMRAGDGAAIEAETMLAFEADTDADILLIDLP
jgi:redox-sensitive bicupin YhaK (pirin superfamily)